MLSVRPIKAVYNYQRKVLWQNNFWQADTNYFYYKYEICGLRPGISFSFSQFSIFCIMLTKLNNIWSWGSCSNCSKVGQLVREIIFYGLYILRNALGSEDMILAKKQELTNGLSVYLPGCIFSVDVFTDLRYHILHTYRAMFGISHSKQFMWLLKNISLHICMYALFKMYIFLSSFITNGMKHVGVKTVFCNMHFWWKFHPFISWEYIELSLICLSFHSGSDDLNPFHEYFINV